MRILAIVLVSAVAGGAIGGAAAYIEMRSDVDAVVDLMGNASPAPPPSGAKLAEVQVDEPIFKFGVMEKGTTKSHDFVIRNVGTGPLRLKVGDTSCKCTLSEVTSGAIAPGESTHAHLEWSAKSDKGPFRQSAIIYTNDPRQTQIDLSVEGEIVEARGIEPGDFMFDKMAFGETKSAEVYVMAMLQDTLEVKSAELSDVETRDHFDIRIEPVERSALPDKTAKDGVRITLTAKPGLRVGRFHQWLTLYTNLADGGKLDIPVIGRVYGDISVHGTGWNEEEGVLMLGRVKSSEGRKGHLNLVVRGADAANAKIEVQSVEPSELKVTIGEPKKLKETLVHVPVEVEVPAGTRPMVRTNTAQGEEGRVVLKTSQPSTKELVLGVRFAVER